MKKTKELPRYRYVCRKINGCLKPDKPLSESIWKDIEIIALVRNDGKKLEPSYSTQAQICRDDENLYIRFSCKDPYIWATMKGHSEPLWKEEVVEVFFDPDGDGKNYVELELNPLNNTLTLLIPSSDTVGNWRENAKFKLKNLKTYISRYSGGWTANITVPFKNFAPWVNVPPREGDMWRLNLYRVERPVMEKPQDCILIAWSPTFKNNFHIPKLFGTLIFNGRE